MGCRLGDFVVVLGDHLHLVVEFELEGGVDGVEHGVVVEDVFLEAFDLNLIYFLGIPFAADQVVLQVPELFHVSPDYSY